MLLALVITRRIRWPHGKYSLRSVINKKCLKRRLFDLPRDIVIYENKTDSFTPKLMIFAGFSQWVVTGYMSFVMSQHMPSFFSWIPIDENTKRDEKSDRLPLADWKYRFAFSAFTLSVSTAIFFTTIVFSLRSVTTITLLKGSDSVLFSTRTPIGSLYNVTSPIMHVSALQPRSAKIDQIPLKLKDHRFHFIVDKDGTFPQPSLFDRTIGVNRNFGKEEK